MICLFSTFLFFMVEQNYSIISFSPISPCDYSCSQRCSNTFPLLSCQESTEYSLKTLALIHRDRRCLNVFGLSAIIATFVESIGSSESAGNETRSTVSPSLWRLLPSPGIIRLSLRSHFVTSN